MLISATGNSIGLKADIPDREGGFTLTELMVVLVILGMLASAVVFVMPDPRGRLIDEGEAFAARAHAAQEAAIVEMSDTAMWVSPTGYGFERHDGEDWISMARPPFEDREWAEDVVVSITPTSTERTRIIFDATGLNDPLDVSLARDENSVSVSIGADGTISIDG
ncbi:prepilin-type N-terminal cleavage/methylation domain-containing protein [Parasphingopyxis sp. CP4]|uniref:prepilin-type N-terminal cleavage/methylation domain-containing protein n=1 Tax=Parasphingopyxis sp. CP4 TaxID=2724527 RepID=UPI00210798CF|nr:prepilin-type N-terminal cleavage/methylation domain-containing protein [Parasphingopyxis sp. CP4]